MAYYLRSRTRLVSLFLGVGDDHALTSSSCPDTFKCYNEVYGEEVVV